MPTPKVHPKPATTPSPHRQTSFLEAPTSPQISPVRHSAGDTLSSLSSRFCQVEAEEPLGWGKTCGALGLPQGAWAALGLRDGRGPSELRPCASGGRGSGWCVCRCLVCVSECDVCVSDVCVRVWCVCVCAECGMQGVCVCAHVCAPSVCIGQTVGLIPWAGCLVPTLGLRREHQGPQGCSLEGGRAEVPPCGCRAPPPTPASCPHGAGHDRHTSGAGALALLAPQSSSVHMSKTPGARRATRVTSAAQTASWVPSREKSVAHPHTPAHDPSPPWLCLLFGRDFLHRGLRLPASGSSPAPSPGNLSSFV